MASKFLTSNNSKIDLPMVFPSDISNAVNRPMVVFTQASEGGSRQISKMISLPIPTSIQTADKSTYSEKELGAGGNLIAGMLQTNKVGNAVNDAFAAGKDAVGSVFGEGTWGSKIAVLAKTLKSVSPNIESAANIGSHTVFNPYANTEFSGVGTRSFSFKFSLIPTSQEEAEIIRNIVYAFRLGVYPVSQYFQLLYPPEWTIRFMVMTKGGGNSDGLKEMKHIPKIFSCYLESVDSTFNSSNNMWRSDAAPFATELSLSFKETRALTYEDIVALDNNVVTNRKGISMNNEFKSNAVASTIAPTNSSGPNTTNSSNVERIGFGQL